MLFYVLPVMVNGRPTSFTVGDIFEFCMDSGSNNGDIIETESNGPSMVY